MAFWVHFLGPKVHFWGVSLGSLKLFWALFMAFTGVKRAKKGLFLDFLALFWGLKMGYCPLVAFFGLFSPFFGKKRGNFGRSCVTFPFWKIWPNGECFLATLFFLILAFTSGIKGPTPDWVYTFLKTIFFEKMRNCIYERPNDGFLVFFGSFLALFGVADPRLTPQKGDFFAFGENRSNRMGVPFWGFFGVFWVFGPCIFIFPDAKAKFGGFGQNNS